MGHAVTISNVPNRGGWATVPRSVIRNPNLSDAAKLLFTFMASEVACWRGRDAFAHSNGFAATALGWSVSKVRRALVELVAAGVIVKEKTPHAFAIVTYRLKFTTDEAPSRSPVTEDAVTGDQLPPVTGDRQIQTKHNKPPQTARSAPTARGGDFVSLSDSDLEAMRGALEPVHGPELDGTDGRPTVEQTLLFGASHRAIRSLKTKRAQIERLKVWVANQVAIEKRDRPRAERAQTATTTRGKTAQLLAQQQTQQANACAPDGGFEALRMVIRAQTKSGARANA